MWLNFALTAAVMTMLVWGLVEPPVILMIGVGIALVLNFPRVAAQSDQLKAHAASVVSVVALVFAASVLTGVLTGTGMVEAMAAWLVDIIPTSFGPHLAICRRPEPAAAFFMSNDAFYFGVLPSCRAAATAASAPRKWRAPRSSTTPASVQSAGRLVPAAGRARQSRTR